MSNLDPNTPATPEVKDDPKRPNKAIVTAVGSAVLTFGASWVADTDPFTAKEAVNAGIAAILLGGTLGGITFTVPNPKVLRRR